MDWCQVYINTIELMADLASQDWDGELYGPEPLEIYGGPRFTTQIFVFPVLPSIKNKYLVWALYQIGLQLTVRHASQRTEFLAGISLQRQRIGFFTYTNRQPGLANYPANSTHLLDGSYPANNTSTTASRQPSDLHVPSTNSILRAKYARVVDRDDRKLKIEYEFDGVKIAPARVFSAYMDALAIAAPHNSNEAGATVAARSADGRVSINVRRNPTYYNFTWGELVKALSTIWRQVIIRYDSLADARWEGMSFLIEYNGRLVGEGFLVCYD